MKKPQPLRRHINVKRLAALLLTVGVAGGSAYAANAWQVRRNADQLLALARDARAANNTDDAFLLYQNYLNFQPKDLEATAEYAAILDADPNPKAKRALIDTYERMVLAAPGRAEERKKLAKLYLTYQVFTSAKHHLEYLLDPQTGTPDQPELVEQLAACEFRLGRKQEGAALLRKLIESKKASADVYLRLADLVRQENLPTSAADADQLIERMAKDLPGDTTARVIHIQHLYKQGRADAAREEILAAARQVKEADRGVDLALLLADLFTREQKYESAREVIATAIAQHPADTRLRTAHYQVLGLLKDKAKAADELRKAAELATNNDPVTIELLDLMIDNREYALARQEADRRYKGKEAYRPVYDYLTGRLALAEGNWPAALPALTRCLEFFERYPAHYAKAQVSVAQCQRQANNPERTLEAYTKAAVANPQSAEARLGRAEALLRLNRFADAEPILRELADAVPAARLLLVRATFVQQLNQPPAARNWAAFDASLGKPPHPVGVEVVRAEALAAQGKAADAETLLRQLAARAPDAPTPRVALAELVARRDAKEAAAVLAEGERLTGDRAAFRIARATLIARTTRDAAAVRALADNAGAFPAADRNDLFAAVANLLVALDRPADAVPLLKDVAAAKPFDLTPRMALTEIYLQAKQFPEADAVIAELKKLDGDAGPVALFAQVLGELARTPKLDKAKADELRAKLQAIGRQREAWTRPHVVLGDVAQLANDPDAALVEYRRAYDLGDREDAVARKYANLLLARGRQEEARRLLDDRDRLAPLPPDLRQTLALLDAAAGRGGEQSKQIVERTADSTDPRQQLFRGNWFLLTGDPAAAVKAFAKAAEHGPQLPEAWVALVQAQVFVGDRAGAAATLAKVGPALAAGRDKAAVPLAVGKCQELVGDLPAAEQTYLAGLREFAGNPPLNGSLADLYRRVGKHADADVRCNAILASGDASDDLKRGARRSLAIGKAAGPAAHTRLDAAVALIDENLKAGERPEDLRAKAFLLAADPFRRAEAHQLLDRSAARDPLPPDDLAKRAMLYLQEGRVQQAEKDLRDATAGPAARLLHLVLLHQVQLKANRLEAAAETLGRITAAAPKTWDAVAAEAGQLAKQGEKARAADAVRAFPDAAKPEFQLRAAAPLLQEVGCTAEAEALYRQVVETTQLPGRHAALVLFLIDSQQPLKAVRAAWAADLPPAAKAALVRNAVAFRPRAAVPAADQPEWDRVVGEAAAWVAAQRKANPTDVAFVLADAAILDATGRYDDAIAAYERAVQLDGQQPGALNNLATLLALHKKDASPRPLDLANKALALAGPRNALLDTRAMVRVAAGKAAEAIADLAAARALEPRAVNDFHTALAVEQTPEGEQKRKWLDAARQKGLTKASLHPLEWPAYERLYGPD